MRILISDYSGHPFQVELSRELARRGHTVRHLHFAGFQTPKGKLLVQSDDPPGLEIEGITLGQPFAKSSFVKRWQQEHAVGRAIATNLLAFAPDLVISSNAPLDTQRHILAASRKAGAGFVFWLQDIYSAAITRVVPEKLPVVGHAIAAWYRHLEFAMLRASDQVVAITEDFRPELERAGVNPARITAIENWAPLDDLPSMPRDNAWAAANYPADGLRFVYSGTLGYKHNPHWLPELARQFPAAQVCVFSEGEVATALAGQAASDGLGNLVVRPWVPMADLPAMLAGADVLVAFVEPEAGIYSVPSKILTYLAVGRPILAAMPTANLAARLIETHRAGLVCGCDATAEFAKNAAELANNPPIRTQFGANGRDYALRNFAISGIADRFMAVCDAALSIRKA